MIGKAGIFARRPPRLLAVNWSGSATAEDPMTGPDSDDVTFTVYQAGTFHWSGLISDGQTAYSWTVKRNGNVMSSGSGTLATGNTSADVGDLMRIEAGAAFNVGNLQVWIV